MKRVAIIGAGVSGLVCARHLHDAGVAVRVFEKSRSLAGRCASRRFDDAIIDTGAPYFSLTDPEIRHAMSSLLGSDLCEITRPVLDASGRRAHGAGYYHRHGNNRIGRALAEGLDIRQEALVESITSDRSGVTVFDEKFDAAVLCAPWPQTAAILGLDRDAISYSMCLTAAFSYDGRPDGIAAATYGMKGGASLIWSACENAKPGRVPDGRCVFIAQADPEFSTEHFKNPPAVWADLLRRQIETRWELDPSAFRATFTHRWKFAFRTSAELDAGVALPENIFICGDSAAPSRVEAVWTSGADTARRVRARLG